MVSSTFFMSKLRKDFSQAGLEKNWNSSLSFGQAALTFCWLRDTSCSSQLMILLEGTLLRPLPIEQVNLKIYLPSNPATNSTCPRRPNGTFPALLSILIDFFCHTCNITRKISNNYIKRKTKYDQFLVIFNNSGVYVVKAGTIFLSCNPFPFWPSTAKDKNFKLRKRRESF